MAAGVSPQPAAAVRPYAGLPVRRFQVILLVTSVALAGTSGLIQGRMGVQDVAEYFIFTFIVGNCTRLAALSTARLYGSKSFPWDLLLLLFIQIPACIGGGYAAVRVLDFEFSRTREGHLGRRPGKLARL